MKKITPFAIALLFSTCYYAQRSDLTWDGSIKEDRGEITLTLPKVQSEQAFFDQNNLMISLTRDAQRQDLEVTEMQWDVVTEAQLFDINPHDLPSRDMVSVTYIYTEEGRKANIFIGGFKKANGKILRLRTFTVRAAVNSSAEAKNNSTGKIGTTLNPLKDGRFYKIKVDKTGVFKITKDFLQANGINPASVNPKNLKIYGNGGIMLPEYNQDLIYDALQENAIQVVGEADGVWNDGDYALFYAQGADGFNLYDTGVGNGIKRKDHRYDSSLHLKNIYEDAAYYFITFDQGPGKRIQTVDEALPPTLITSYDEYQYVDNDQINLLRLGRTWVESASYTTPKTVTFTLAEPVVPDSVLKYSASNVAHKAQGTSLVATVNGKNPQTFPIATTASADYRKITYNGILDPVNGTTVTFNFAPNIAANPNANFYFDYAEILYRSPLRYRGQQQNFRDYSLDTGSGFTYGFSIENAGQIEQVWDVSDITNVNRRVNKSGNNTVFSFGYTANNDFFNNEFVAFKSDAAYTPGFVGPIANQNLQLISNIDYLIITTGAFIPQAQRLAAYHQQKNNMSTAVVDVAQIYNEFSSGSQDLTAIRNFITSANRPSGKLKYVLLLGDTSFDYKNRTPNNTNIVPAYQSEYSGDYAGSYVSDDYIVVQHPQTNAYLTNQLPDIPIGRLPAASVEEAKLLIDKTLAYYNNLPGQSTPFGDWRMRLDFIADDNNEIALPFHNTVNNAVAKEFETNTAKPEYNIRKLYLDSFVQQSTAGGPRYPQVNQAIANDFSNTLSMFYFGHGGINGWAQERIFTLQEIQPLNNYNKQFTRFPFVTTITCEFTLWDDPGTFSAGEQVIKHKNGGATNMITSSRAIAVSYAEEFTPYYINHLFKLNANDQFDPIGTAHLNAKKEYAAKYNIPPDNLRVNVLGDPAMPLARPRKLISIDQITSPVPNLLRALDFVKIQGHVNNPGGGVNTAFNGRVTVNIFDKRLAKTTLNNDGNLTPVMQYTEEGQAIVKASGQAVNGQFTVEFYMPKDINYNIGTGRILVYADNGQTDAFYNTPYQIGDINPNGITDNEPPKVRLYMNNTNFADTGITDRNPTLLACITDDTGINTSGAGIGHDITTYLDGQIINTILLNDFYNSGEGAGCTNPSLKDFQKGYVTYPFRNLAPGDHTLTFKVWDINNNSTTETLRFTVKDQGSQEMEISRLLNWPNPFTDKTYFHFEHNCADILNVNVQIYTITGRLVKTITQSVTSEPYQEGFRTPKTAIMWDGTDDYGDPVGRGTYIYKVYARGMDSEKCRGGAGATEKLVILK